MTTTTTTSATTDTTSATTTSTSSSTFTGSSYTRTTTSGDSSSLRTYDRSSFSSMVPSDITELEQMIFKLKEQLDAHKRRADAEERRANDAEKRILEYAEHLTKVNKARLIAQQEATKANEELRLYKLQLEYAQREINRAQSVLDDVERQRHVAEKEASEAKAFARKLKEELMIDNARREGRRQGLQEGLDRGRHLILQETEPMVAAQRRISSLGQESFMNESFGSSSSDDRSISTESHVTLQADRRPRERRQSNPPPPASVARSSPPLPIPEPRQAASRAPSAIHEQRSASRAPSVTHEQHPASRAPSAIYEQRPSSRAPSVIHDQRPASRAPTVIRDPSPAPRAPSTAQEYHSRAPSVVYDSKSPQIRSGSAQGYFSSIPPPDNYIPSLDQDGNIRLPPPSRFHKLHTPERLPSPSLPPETHPVIYRHSSPESASTTLSHIDLLRDPYNGQVAVTPALSAIEEVSSQMISPWPPTAPDLKHQSSVFIH
ncbi:hypothetical protein EST38_g4534 [Candolleomyces aberdarensis]|uniref:Uncharacterized protein n=1 Tax=Candolleomyces aberdarensis TaxID=2316362 RepID=A0A4Q2DQP6_9AGAR|nr:hypothetical protein EST38_g4534 [Candolleomyces aberdarensis]